MSGLEHLILHGSCLQLSPAQLPANAILCADTPYSAHVHENCETGIGSASQVGVRKRSLGFDSLSDELRSHVAALGARCRWSVIFSDWEGLSAWKAAFVAQPGYRYVRVVPWIRWSSPQRTGDRPPSGSEAIILAGPTSPMRWNGPGNLTHFDEACERGADKHTTAKPLDLMLRLLEYFSEPGELIVDPTCGRGTAILAAKLLGRSGLGIELQQSEAELARERVAQAPALGKRDADRLERYQKNLPIRMADQARCAEINAATKERNRARKLAQTRAHP